MPRDIPVGNGQLLVTFDHYYQIRDLYFPHVGQENHAGGGPCRFGAWASLPNERPNPHDRRRRRLYWTSQGWNLQLGYKSRTLATDVSLRHAELRVALRCTDVVDFHRPLLVRRVDVTNQAKEEREIRLFQHNDFHMFGTKMGDTAYYDPQLAAMIHYRKTRYLMATWQVEGERRIDQYAAGTSGFHGAEGTWRDAEDGQLGGNPIAQGAVDSTIMVSLRIPAGETRSCYLLIGAGEDQADLETLLKFVERESPQGIIDRTCAYWRLWLTGARVRIPKPEHAGPSQRVAELFERSLLLVRTQIDNSGAIIAANDSDIMQFSRDTYSYLWPRDGALVSDALDAAGFPDAARGFFSLCSRIIKEGGYFLHKYCPDGSPASSWHPWVALGKPQLPIQEDETALVLWALWRHFSRHRDVEFVRGLWMSLINRAADFLVRFRDPVTHLPLPSWDLWEERWGVHAFTVATVYAGLRAAYEFAVCFGDEKRAARYSQAADEVRAAFCAHFWSKEKGRFHRRIVPLDHDRTARLMGEVAWGQEPRPNGVKPPGKDAAKSKKLAFEYDDVVDSSLYAIFAMGLMDVHDERVEKTMAAVERELWVKTPVGGLARYVGDHYHRASPNVPGNPWFICTLWLADYRIARARTTEELGEALPILEWVADHALPSGVLAEQVHPDTNAPLSVSPLTWSHATVVSTLATYMQKLSAMNRCPACGQPRVPGEEDDTRSHACDPLSAVQI